jgi:N-acetylglucosaminyl-diphospho-decaprenol L-rhamnosyltransferase
MGAEPPASGGAIDVVIPTYDGWRLLERCLEHLRSQTVEHQVFVVDDGSSDGTPARTREGFPAATVVEMPGNRGFARAVNAGCAAGSGEFVVILNNDVECRPTFLERVVAPLRADPEVGSVAAMLLQADEKTIDSLGLEVDRTLAGFPRHWGEFAGSEAIDATAGLLGPAGAAAGYRRSALEEVGGLDESIFAYNEDVDLALRLRAAGWRCAAAPDAVAVHLGSATFGVHTPKQVFHRGWSRGYLLRKYRLGRDRRELGLAVLGEAASVAFQLAATRDQSGLRGRIAGWRSGRPELAVPPGTVNPDIGFFEAIRRRRSYRSG